MPNINAAFQSVVQIQSEEFQDENVTIILNWAKGNNEFYNASIILNVPMHYKSGNTTVELTLQYNTPYSVSIMANLCDYNTTDVIDLHYGKYIQ